MRKNARGAYRIDGEEASTAEQWDRCVEYLMGPRMIGEPKDAKHREALELAAAALQFAGEDELAANLLDE